MSALLDAILRAVRFWLRGWWAMGALLHHPAESVRLAWSLRKLARDASSLLIQMAESGVTVETPKPDQIRGPPPVLRTRLTGFGDVMTFVEPRSLTAELADIHLARVRDKLRPLHELGSAIARMQALVTAAIACAMTLYSAITDELVSRLQRGVSALVLSLLVTLLASLLLQVLPGVLMRRVRARLGATHRCPPQASKS